MVYPILPMKNCDFTWFSTAEEAVTGHFFPEARFHRCRREDQVFVASWAKVSTGFKKSRRKVILLSTTMWGPQDSVHLVYNSNNYGNYGMYNYSFLGLLWTNIHITFRGAPLFVTLTWPRTRWMCWMRWSQRKSRISRASRRLAMTLGRAFLSEDAELCMDQYLFSYHF